jgi:8-oxo-dGTP pyrophosphatase MutT (NUDIX family)
MQDKHRLRRATAHTIRRAPWIAITARWFYRFLQARFSAGVVGVIFNADGEVLLVEHVFHPYHPWGLPGGWVDRREDPAATLIREMREELELQVEVGPVLLAKVDYGSHIDLAYLCHQTGPIGTLSGELLGYRWLPPDNLPRLHSFHYRAIQRALEISARA